MDGRASKDATTALILQMEARIRALEASLYATCMVPTRHPAVQESKHAITNYINITKADPWGHGLGGADALVGAAFMKGMARTPLPDGADPPLQCRQAAVILIAMLALTQDLRFLHEWITHFVVADLHGNREGTSLVIFKLDGRMLLPDPGDEANMVIQAVEQAIVTGQWDRVAAVASLSYTYQDGEPTPVGNRSGISIQKLLMSVMCATGGTRPTGRAPRGPLARQIKGKGKGKDGKGK